MANFHLFLILDTINNKIPKWRGSRHFGKITGQYSRPQFTFRRWGPFASWQTWST
jgi:hypothetical protein